MKYYTSEVPVGRTIGRIEDVLAAAGIKNIMKDYAGGEVVGLYFTLPHPKMAGVSVPVRLPADVAAVFKVLKSEYTEKYKWTDERVDRLMVQARRTAWRLMQEWVEIQLTLIELGQAEELQVFLPYVWLGSQTYYAKIKGNDFKALPAYNPEGHEKEKL